MPLGSLPAIDAQICIGWTENQRDLYNSLDFYLAKTQVERRKTWAIWSKFLGKQRWTPNQGDTMRLVRTEPSPHMRQFANPALLSAAARKDVMNVRETRVDVNLHHHKFESPVLNFYPSFNDFMDHVDDHGKDIMEKMERFEDVYYRGMIFHMSPFAFCCKANGDVELVQTPFWDGLGEFNATTMGKNTPVVTDLLARTTGSLSLLAANKMLTIMENDLRIPFFQGTGTPGGDDSPLNGNYCLVTSSEAYNMFSFDPYLQQNKNCDLDVVNQSFRGKLFGRVTCRLEDLILRCKNDATWPAPELRVEAPANVYNLGETLPNPDYAYPVNSPFEVGFMVGAQGYKAVPVGPPPSKFTGDSPPHNFPAMFWNGEVQLTKQFLTECVDADTGEVRLEMNTYGEYLKFISHATYAIAPIQRRNIIPVFYRRNRAAA